MARSQYGLHDAPLVMVAVERKKCRRHDGARSWSVVTVIRDFFYKP
jgi:hypothetical protein